MKVILVVHRDYRKYWVRRDQWDRDPRKAHTFTLRHEANDVARKHGGTVGTLYEALRRQETRYADSP